MDLSIVVFLDRSTAADIARRLVPAIADAELQRVLDGLKFEDHGDDKASVSYHDLEEALKGSGVFAPTKKDRMLAYFRIVDKDNSGTIDASELTAMMRRVNKADLEGLSEEDAKETLENMVNEILSAVDANEDGVIEWDEFKVLDF